MLKSMSVNKDFQTWHLAGGCANLETPFAVPQDTEIPADPDFGLRSGQCMKRSAMTRSLTKLDAYVFHYKFKVAHSNSQVVQFKIRSNWASGRPVVSCTVRNPVWPRPMVWFCKIVYYDTLDHVFDSWHWRGSTHCGLVTPYSNRDLGQHWLR